MIFFRVVWGLGVTMDNLHPKKSLIRVDLPTFGLPTMAT